MAIGALLSPLGEAAPAVWVWLSRTAALGAVVLAYVLGRRLAKSKPPLDKGTVPPPTKRSRGLSPSGAGGIAAAGGVVFAQGWLGFATGGDSEPLLIGCALLAALAWLDGRHRALLAAGLACALIRVEAWPFLVAGLWLTPALRPAVVPAVAALPALWFLPELAGSGDLMRSAERARVPNPGQPALAAVPALESLQRAAGLALWPLPLGLAALRPASREGRLALALGAGGLLWILLVAAMAQLGFSGEERYALPGVALVSVAAAAGLPHALAWLPGRGRLVVALAVAALAAGAGLRLAAFAPEAGRQAHQATLASDLRDAVAAAAGGRDAVLACGTPYTGALRGPMVAWALDVEKHRVEFDPHPPGVVFSSRLERDEPLEPAPADGTRTGEWVVAEHCY